MKQFLCIGVFVLFAHFLAAQATFSGKVVESSQQHHLPGVNIWHVSSGQLAVSDRQGNFALSGVNTGDTLLFSFVGYDTQAMVVGDQRFIVMVLQPTAYELNEVVVSAYGDNRALKNVGGAVGLIRRKELYRENDVSVVPSLNRIPGVYMQSGALNTNRLTIRGIGARSPFSTTKIRAYLEDIPLTTGEGETTIEDIDLEILERVEVIKGPTSSIYGAGLGGTLQLVPRKPLGEEINVTGQVSGGSFGLRRVLGSVKSSNHQGGLYLNYNHTSSDGYRANNTYDRQSFTGLGQWLAGENTQLTLLATWIDLKALIPSSLNEDDFRHRPQIAAPNWQATRGGEDNHKLLTGLSIRQSFSPTLDLRGAVFGSHFSNFEVRPFNILDESAYTLGLRNLLFWQPVIGTGQLQVKTGVEYFHERYNWRTFENENAVAREGLSNNRERRRYYNLFAESVWEPANKVRITAGLNFNRTNYRLDDRFPADSIDQSGDYTFKNIWSPRLAIQYSPGISRAFYATMSHGFSPPTLEETLNPEGSLNPEIQPETGWNYEVGFRGEVLNKRLFLDISIYTMQIENLLVARRTAEDAFVGINAGKTIHNGVELSFNYPWIRNQGVWQRVQWFGTYTYAHYRFKEFIDDDEDFSGNRLTGVPPHWLNLGLDLETKFGLFAHLTALYVDEIPANDANTVSAESYAVMNVKIGWSGKIGRHLIWTAYAGVNNLFDEKYAAMVSVNASGFGGQAPRYFYPGLPVHYYGGLRVSYGW